MTSKAVLFAANVSGSWIGIHKKEEEEEEEEEEKKKKKKKKKNNMITVSLV